MVGPTFRGVDLQIWKLKSTEGHFRMVLSKLLDLWFCYELWDMKLMKKNSAVIDLNIKKKRWIGFQCQKGVRSINRIALRISIYVRCLFLFDAHMHLSVKIRLRHRDVCFVPQMKPASGTDSKSFASWSAVSSFVRGRVEWICEYGSKWLEFHQSSLFLLHIIHLIVWDDSRELT